MHERFSLRATRLVTLTSALTLSLFARTALADDASASPPGAEGAPATPAPSAPVPGAPTQPESDAREESVPDAAAPPYTVRAAKVRSDSQEAEPIYFVDDEERPPLPFREGTQVPKGFRLDTSPRAGLIVAGASTSGALWVVSLISAIALDKQPAVEGDPNFDDMYWPMFIPVVGPFISIGTADASGTGAGILALDGAFQAGGLALMIAGFAAPKVELVPQKGVYLSAEAAPGAPGLSVGGSF